MQELDVSVTILGDEKLNSIAYFTISRNRHKKLMRF